MTKPNFLILAGLILLGLALREFARAIKTESVTLRGGARITRARRPGIFWFNIGGQMIVAGGGTALVVWGLIRAWPG